MWLKKAKVLTPTILYARKTISSTYDPSQSNPDALNPKLNCVTTCIVSKAKYTTEWSQKHLTALNPAASIEKQTTLATGTQNHQNQLPEMYVQYAHSDPDTERNEYHSEEQVFSKQGDRQGSWRDDLRETQEEHGQGHEDGDAERDLRRSPF